MTNRNIFVRFHSDKHRLLDTRDKYAEEWESSNINLESILELHDQDKQYLIEDYSGTYLTENSKTMTNLDAYLLREGFKSVLTRESDLDMTDYASLLKTIHVFTCHARSGGGVFEHQYPFHTDDLVRSLGIDSAIIRKKRQVMLADVFRWVDDALNSIQEGNPKMSLDVQGEPLLGLQSLIGYGPLNKADLTGFLKGMVFFGYADKWEQRQKAMKENGICLDDKKSFRIGGGMDLPFNMELLDSFAIMHPEQFFLPEYMDSYVSKNIILEDPRPYEHPRAKNFYIRFDESNGFSDIAGIMILNRTQGKMCAIGGAIMDGVDTYKDIIYDPFYGNASFYLARYIEENYKDTTGTEILSEKEKNDFIYLGAKNNIDKLVISVSHRYLNKGTPSPLNAILNDDNKHNYRQLRAQTISGNIGQVSELVDTRLLNFTG